MTGGFRIDDINGKNIHIDPGPGALVRTYQFGLNPLKLNGVLVSHCHTDHYTDAEVLIEAMTRGMIRRKGFIIGSESVINGCDDCGPNISHYHQSKSQVVVLKPGKSEKIDGIKITATETRHGDPLGIGFKIQHGDFTISYTSDTGYFEELHKEFLGSDVLIGSVIRPINDGLRGHMCTNDFGKLLNEVSPKLGIMTHLGMKIIMKNPESEAAYLTKETGIKTIAAHDGLKINLDDYQTKQQTLDEYPKK